MSGLIMSSVASLVVYGGASFEVASPAACKLRYYTVGMAAAVCDCLFCGRSTWVKFSVVTVAGICNSVGGSVLFEMPPRCRCRWLWQISMQCGPCIAGQSSVPFPFPHTSAQRTCHPSPPLLIILYTMRSSLRWVTRPIAEMIASFNSA